MVVWNKSLTGPLFRLRCFLLDLQIKLSILNTTIRASEGTPAQAWYTSETALKVERRGKEKTKPKYWDLVFEKGDCRHEYT